MVKVEQFYWKDTKLMEHYHNRMDELQTHIFQIISENYSHIDIDDIAHLNNYLGSPLIHAEEIGKLEIKNNLPDQVMYSGPHK